MASTISAGTTAGTAIVVSGDTSGSLQLRTNGTTTAVTIDTSQNVGIGTATPVAKLHVSGDMAISSAAAYMSNLYYSGGWKYIGNGYGGVFKPAESDGSISFQQAPNNTLGANAAATPSQTMSVTAAGILQFNSGYGSAATAYGCRAWVNFNGTGTVAIRGSGNVSSITDNGTGDYTVNFTTAMVDANYSVASIGAYNQSSAHGFTELNNGGSSAITTSSCRISNVYSTNTSGGVSALDQPIVTLAVFR